jgi:hypothetical protein
VLAIYPDAIVDEAKAEHSAGNWAREWERRSSDIVAEVGDWVGATPTSLAGEEAGQAQAAGDADGYVGAGQSLPRPRTNMRTWRFRRVERTTQGLRSFRRVRDEIR